jgi:hypothetical protein
MKKPRSSSSLERGKECRRSTVVRREPKVEPGLVLEFQRPVLVIAFAADDNKGSHKADYFEVSAQFHGVPDLPILGFECLTATWAGVDLSDSLAAIGLGFIKHL